MGVLQSVSGSRYVEELRGKLTNDPTATKADKDAAFAVALSLPHLPIANWRKINCPGRPVGSQYMATGCSRFLTYSYNARSTVRKRPSS